MSTNITKLRRSQATSPLVPDYYCMTPSGFVTLATLVALQGGRGPTPMDDVAWMLAHWGACADDNSFEDRVWSILSKSPSIEVVYGEGNTTFLNFSLNETPVMTLTVKGWVEFHITQE